MQETLRVDIFSFVSSFFKWTIHLSTTTFWIERCNVCLLLINSSYTAFNPEYKTHTHNGGQGSIQTNKQAMFFTKKKIVVAKVLPKIITPYPFFCSVINDSRTKTALLFLFVCFTYTTTTIWKKKKILYINHHCSLFRMIHTNTHTLATTT